jgi:hypothetical protein
MAVYSGIFSRDEGEARRSEPEPGYNMQSSDLTGLISLTEDMTSFPPGFEAQLPNF